MSQSPEVGPLLTSVRKYFAEINRDPDLNDEGEKRPYS
jgi:hypothetical protein